MHIDCAIDRHHSISTDRRSMDYITLNTDRINFIVDAYHHTTIPHILDT